MAQSLIQDLLIILTAGLVAGLVCRWLKVSVLIGYLVVGTLLGGGSLGWVLDEYHQLEYFAEAGVFLLLFSIGLEFSLDDLKSMGANLLIGGSVQMLLVAVPTIGVLWWLGMAVQPAVLLGAAAAFSSTVLVFKALSEWGQTSQPHGRRAVGVLLFQDAALVPLLLLVPLLTGSGQTAGPLDYLILAAKSSFFVLAVVGARWLLARWVIPLFAGFRSPELIILFTLCSLGGVTLAAYSLGLPPAVGAFAAGLIFNGNRWTKQIDALVLPFRETFSAVFFVGLGLIFDPQLILREPLTMLSALVGLIVIKALAATLALRLTGLGWAAATGMGVGLAHIGEFAFVLVLLGLESGVLSELQYQRLVAVAVGSLILTPPLLKAGLKLTRSCQETESLEGLTFERGQDVKLATVIGAGPIGRQVASQLEVNGRDVCIVDLSPINLHLFAQEGFRTVVGDATDPTILELARVSAAATTVVCVPNDEVAIQVVKAVRKLNSQATVFVRCRFLSNAAKLRTAGADAVVSEEAEASQALLKKLVGL